MKKTLTIIFLCLMTLGIKAQEQLQMLNKGIKFVSINTYPNIYRCEFYKDKVGKKLYDKFQEIKDLY